MIEKIMVISSDGTKDIFKPRLIGQFIKEKTQADDKMVKKIQNRIVTKIRNLNVTEITTTQIMAEVTAQLTKENIKEEPYVIIKESDIMNLLTSYDNNNANQVFSAGALEYSLFEMTSKRYMNTQYSEAFREAKDYGLIYNHDSAQELFKGINCFTIDPRFIFKKGLSTYGDNNLGVISSPPKHLGTAVNLVEEAIGLASTYIAGGVSIPSVGCFFAPFSKGLSDVETKQAFQEFFYRVNQSHKNRGCVSGDTTIWIKLNGEIELKTFKEISDILNANYGSTDLTNIDLKILTLTDDRETKWVKPTLFWRNEPRELYEVTLPKGRNFKCDKYHGLISANNLGVRNILDIKKGTQLCDSTGINHFLDIEKNIDYWNGCLYGFWLGDGYKTRNGSRTTITVGKEDKVAFLDLLFKNLPFEYNRTISNKKTDEKHIISQYVNYHFDKKELIPVDSYMENKNYLAGLITGLINSDGNLRIGTSGGIDCQFSNSNKSYIDILRYAMFFFGIRANKNIKRRGNKKWSTVYRLNFEWNDNAFHLYKQLEFRPLFKEALNDGKRVKWYGPTKRYLVKSIMPLDEKGETFCFTANGRMIIGDGFILTSNSQSMFSSIQLDLEMPEFLKEQDAIGPGGKVCGKYKDYEDENKRLCHILTEISLEGDALGKPILFPNMLYNIDDADLSEWRDVFELSARFSIPYFICPSNNNVEYQSTLGCRSVLASNWSGDPNVDCMGTGNSVYTTICLPAVALKSKEEERDFYEVLDENMQLVHDYNLSRLDWINKLWYEYHVADFMIQKDEDGNQLYDLENATIVMGYVGLSEALEILGYGPIQECNDKAVEIIKYMRATTDRWKKEDNKRWGLFQTPAENAAYKLAQKMVDRFGFKESKARGTAERPYYTNSNHIPYDDDVGIIQKIKLEGNNQPIGPAGNIMNVYTSEAYSEPVALSKFCEKIRDNTNAYFWAFTGDYSICNNCSSLFRGVVDTCPFDKSPTTQYSRVTGYITAVETWNPGKKEEFIRRYRYGS